MITSVRPLALAVATTAALAACGGGNGTPTSTPAGLASLPTIKFAGNSTCPSSAATPYFTSSGAVKPADVNSLPAVGEPVDEMPHTHVNRGTMITYDHNPPTSGCHYNLGYGTAPIQTGAYNQQIPPEFWVHNLEHGYVVVLYNCPSGCDPQFQQLRTWRKSLPNDPSGNFAYAKVIILPYASMPVPFAAVSWDWYDPIPVFSVAEVQRFYDNHVGRGPEPVGA